jgi:hypothetical protein
MSTRDIVWCSAASRSVEMLNRAARVVAAVLGLELAATAEEAALSRLYGGIHFRRDNEAGLALGRRTGQDAVGSASTTTPERLRNR